MNFKTFCSKLIILLILLTVCSCGSNSQKAGDNGNNEYEWVGNTIEEENVPDSMIRVTLIDYSDDSIFVKINSTNENKSYGYYEAQKNGLIKGSWTKGHLYAIMPESKFFRITTAVNLTELFGQWFFDMKEHRGMKFETKGSLSSINTENISFKRWMFRNGKLLIFYVYMQQVAEKQSEFEVEETEIISLSKDELKFKFKGKLLNCRRQREAIKFKFGQNS